MKFKHYIYIGLASISLTACNDFLEVGTPSKYPDSFVYGQKSEIERALNGVYAQALVGDLYGNAYQRTFILNSDVDIQINSSRTHSHTGYSRFDCDDQGSDIRKYWTASYNLIEYANRFIYGVENGPLYDNKDQDIMQWIGEAKCLRAMAYHDMVVMFGDLPFTFARTEDRGTNDIIPIADRQAIQDSLIADLSEIATYMQSTNSTTVERCSKEFAQALIARIALTAGGYSLRPDKANPKNTGKMERPVNYKDYYEIAKKYADAVIKANTHQLSLPYHEVFIQECNYQLNNNDDVIFELPFAKESTGNTGYIQGPTYTDNEGETVGPWGKCDGGARLNAFYRFMFRENDLRREFVNGLWYYTYYQTTEVDPLTGEEKTIVKDSVMIRNDYSVHNNKWSKLWTSESQAMGNNKTGSTGINFPYMRYTDVLLMYAEADNELNDGPTGDAIDCLTKVHSRAFLDGDASFISEASASKEAFLKAVLDERKWEFAGENIRWKDLVRNNLYAEELVYSFLRYYSVAMQNVGSMTGYEDAITEHDGFEYIESLPNRIYYLAYNSSEVKPRGFEGCRKQLYGYTIGDGGNVIYNYPNQTLKSLRIYNPYKTEKKPLSTVINPSKLFGFTATEWLTADFYQWGNTDAGEPKDQCKYSFLGYVQCDIDKLVIYNNGAKENLPTVIDADKLPAVRYILPYPNEAIQRSGGAYKNYYGY